MQAKEARTGVKVKLSQGEAKKRIAKGTSVTRVDGTTGSGWIREETEWKWLEKSNRVTTG